MRARVILIFAIAICCSFQCSLPWESQKPSSLTIVSYNAHNLFDDVDGGDEYPEFLLSSGKWNSELYKTRLENTAKAVLSFFPEKSPGPDILCLQEIETEKVLKDLAGGPLKNCNYRWFALGGPEHSPIKSAILARYPIKEMRAHSIADSWGFGPGRDIIEVTFDVGDPSNAKEKSAGKAQGGIGSGSARSQDGDLLTIFVCHWKSRKEGPPETEEARRSASRLLRTRIGELAESDPLRNIIVCGDFNESPDEFSRVDRKYPTALMPDPDEFSAELSAEEAEIPAEWFTETLCVTFSSDKTAARRDETVLFSPWAGSEGFSYKFKGQPERIDGFLLGPSLLDGSGLEYERFRVSDSPDLFDGKGEPLAWAGRSGFSDHLPVALTLESCAVDQ